MDEGDGKYMLGLVGCAIPPHPTMVGHFLKRGVTPQISFKPFTESPCAPAGHKRQAVAPKLAGFEPLMPPTCPLKLFTGNALISDYAR